ncbi:MAG: hypothetical protein H0T96_00065 [Thermoleophilaceae bacterium]|nr:hypothetical protein [Thermoleophilaceae bacterium]
MIGHVDDLVDLGDVLLDLLLDALAERVDRRRYELSADLRKKQVKAARKR